MLTLLLLAVSLAVPAAVPDLDAQDVRIIIQPSSMDGYQLLGRQSPDSYTCQAMAKQPGSNGIYMTAKMNVLPGHTEKASRYAGEYRMDFSVQLTATTADATVTVKRGEKVISRQRSTVYIAAKQPGNVPLH